MDDRTMMHTSSGSGESPPEQRLSALGIVLPPPRVPVGTFLPVVRLDGLLHLSGQGPVGPDGGRHTGKVGAEVSVDQAYADARLTGINLLAVLRAELGTLARVRIIKLFGMVNAVPGFTAHSRVIDGCSDLFVEVFGPRDGMHARSAIGMASLPGNISVEIEMIVAVADKD
jgi:enamine deaminase RidA (YjgF/YER057c/UK114 family)